MSATFHAETISRRELGLRLISAISQRDLVVDAPVRALPGAPLLAVDRAEIAVGVRPFVPDRDAVGLEIGDVGVAVEEPDQLVDDRLEVQPLRRDERKTLGEIEADLPAEQRAHAGAGAVAFHDALFERLAQEFEIGPHRLAAEWNVLLRRFGPPRQPPALPSAGRGLRRSMHADRLQLMLPRVGDRRVLGVGEHDRRPVGGEQSEQLADPGGSPGPAGTTAARPRT